MVSVQTSGARRPGFDRDRDEVVLSDVKINHGSLQYDRMMATDANDAVLLLIEKNWEQLLFYLRQTMDENSYKYKK